MKKKLLSLFLFTSTNLLAQFSITGNVSDAGTKELLIGATISIEKTFLFTTTDVQGNFVFTNLKAGEYDLKVTYIGYETQQRKIKVDKNVSINFIIQVTVLDKDEIVVTATRADEKSAIPFTKMDKAEIAKSNIGQDIPYMLGLQPSVVTTSDAGTGIGYTGIRIRGSDASRINVTVNGIPLNDAESQQLYWVDLPDLASSLDNIQITRGVGTSTNGSGAFGASIDLQTDKLNAAPFGEAAIGGGSFNSFKRNFKAGTGLINEHFAFEARLSKINSDGYVDRATSDLSSYFISGGYYSSKTSVRVNLISGKEKTYQAWNGVPESRVNNDTQGMHDFIDRNYFDSTDAANLLNSGRTYNYFTYDNQTDNYQQNHYQLFITQNINEKMNLNVSGFYTHGKGYYEEFKKNQSYANYNMTEPVVGADTIFETNLVRQKWLDNDYYGGIVSLIYDSKSKIKITTGGAFYQYSGSHFNKVIWAEYSGSNPTDYEYYNDAALKNDANIFVKMNYAFTEKWNAFADVQYRYVDYQFNGYDVNGIFIPQNNQLNFVNPKAGITFQPDKHKHQLAYASISVGNHEPNRDDYVNSSPQSRPKAESLYDIEAGYRYRSKNLNAGCNFYYMDYKNQLVLTGQLNDVGEYTRTNISSSYRAGIEMDAAYKLSRNWELKAFATFSKNKIKSFDEFLDDYDNGIQILNNYKNTDIAFSPGITACGIVSYSPLDNLSIDIIGKYVGQQFMDNTSNDKRILNNYSTCDLKVGYHFMLGSTTAFKAVEDGENKIGNHKNHGVGFEFNLSAMNLFNKMFESNGYTYSYIYNQQTVTENFFYPQAGTSILGQMVVRF